MAIRRNLVLVSGRIEWKADNVRTVTFQNGGAENYYNIRISVKRDGKKAEKAIYDSFYAEFKGKNAEFAKTYLNVGDYICIEGECAVTQTKKDVNGITVYEEAYTVKVKEFNASKGLYMNENEIRIMGYLAKEPKTFTGSVASTALTVMVNRKGGNGTDAFNVKVFGKSAEYAAKFHKGEAIAVEGRMQPTYFKDGTWYKNAEVISNYVRNPMGTKEDEEKEEKDVEIPTLHSETLSASSSVEKASDILSELELNLDDIESLFG